MHNSSRRFLAPFLVLVIAAGALTAAAQSKSASKSSKAKSTAAAKKATSKYHRLPTYYGQLDLKEEQIKEIYSIRDSFGPKIAELEEELKELKEDQAADIKDVLTRTQVTALNKLLAGTAAKSSSTKSSTKKGTSSKSTSTKKK